jgi:hypothetical protein
MPGRTDAGLVSRWQHFWFEPIPPHSYAALRILFGAFGLLTVIGVANADLFWDLRGLVPIGAPLGGVKVAIVAGGHAALAARALLLACAAAFLLMTLGVASRWSVPAALLAALVQVSWNPLPLAAAHSLMVSLIFALAWADSGRVWSVDAWRRGQRPGLPQEVGTQPIAPLRLIRFQVALVYLSTGLWKLMSPLWRDGTALHYVLNYNVFHRFPIGTAPELEWLLAVGTWVTLAWELVFAFALWWRPTRVLALVAGVLIHAGMIAGLEIGPFSLLMLSAYVAFLNPHALSRLTAPRRAHLAHPAHPAAPGRT